MPKDGKVQGEGDYEATRRYRKRTEDFIENNDVEQVAEDARPESAEEAEELRAAETAGRERAKAEDPAIQRRDAPEGTPSTRSKTSRH